MHFKPLPASKPALSSSPSFSVGAGAGDAQPSIDYSYLVRSSAPAAPHYKPVGAASAASLSYEAPSTPLAPKITPPVKPDCVAAVAARTLASVALPAVDFKTDYPILIVPLSDQEKVIRHLSPFCTVEEDELQDIPFHVCLRLGTVIDQLSSPTIDKLLQKYRMKTPFEESLAKYKRHCEESVAYFTHHTAKGSVLLPPGLVPPGKSSTDKELALTPIPNNGDLAIVERKIIRETLASHEGFCLGEMHLSLSPKLFLKEHMKFLSEQGVTTLYVEFLLFDAYRDALEEYNLSPPDAPIPPLIAQHLNDINKGQNLIDSAGFDIILEEAHRNGIRLVPIDTDASYHYPRTQDSEGGKIRDPYRVINMNRDAAIIIQEDRKGRSPLEKYVVFAGLAHVIHYVSDIKAPGLAEVFNIPAFEITDRAADSSIISFGKCTPSSEDVKHVHIARSLIPDTSSMSHTEKRAWAVYKEKSNSSDLPLEDVKKRSELLKSILLELYREKAHPVLIDLIKEKYLSLLNRQKTPQERLLLPERGTYWPDFQYGCTDLFDMDLAHKLCLQLNGRAPPSVHFNPTKVNGFLQGGACTAICLDYLHHYLELTKYLREDDPSVTIAEIYALKSSQRDYTYPLRAAQAALNSLEKTEVASSDFSKDKIKALLGLQGQTITHASETIDLGNEASFETFKTEFSRLPDGTFLMRSILPSDNEKAEEHGHSMILIKKGDQIFFYDPNTGMKKLSSEVDKATLELYQKLVNVHAMFNTPLLRIYAVAQTAEAPKSLLVKEALRKINLSAEEFESLPPAIKARILLNPSRANQLIESGYTAAHLAAIHPSNLPLLFTNYDVVTSLRRLGISLLDLSIPLDEGTKEQANALFGFFKYNTKAFPTLVKMQTSGLDISSLLKKPNSLDLLKSYSSIESLETTLLALHFLEVPISAFDDCPSYKITDILANVCKIKELGITPSPITTALIMNPKETIHLLENGFPPEQLTKVHPSNLPLLFKNYDVIARLQRLGISLLDLSIPLDEGTEKQPNALFAYIQHNAEAFPTLVKMQTSGLDISSLLKKPNSLDLLKSYSSIESLETSLLALQFLEVPISAFDDCPSYTITDVLANVCKIKELGMTPSPITTALIMNPKETIHLLENGFTAEQLTKVHPSYFKLLFENAVTLAFLKKNNLLTVDLSVELTSDSQNNIKLLSRAIQYNPRAQATIESLIKEGFDVSKILRPDTLSILTACLEIENPATKLFALEALGMSFSTLGSYPSYDVESVLKNIEVISAIRSKGLFTLESLITKKLVSDLISTYNTGFDDAYLFSMIYGGHLEPKVTKADLLSLSDLEIRPVIEELLSLRSAQELNETFLNLESAGISLKELATYPKEVIRFVLRNAYHFHQLKKEGIDWKELMTPGSLRILLSKSQIINSSAIISLKKAGMSLEELSNYTEDLWTPILDCAEFFEKAQHEGIKWREFLTPTAIVFLTFLADTHSAHDFIVTLLKAGITVEELISLDEEQIRKLFALRTLQEIMIAEEWRLLLSPAFTHMFTLLGQSRNSRRGFAILRKNGKSFSEVCSLPHDRTEEVLSSAAFAN